MQLRRHILIASLLLPAAVFAAEPQTGTGENDGYRLVWQDLFDADALSPERWEIEVNGAGGGNNELQYYTDREENVRLGKDEHGNGCLILTARREQRQEFHIRQAYNQKPRELHTRQSRGCHKTTQDRQRPLAGFLDDGQRPRTGGMAQMRRNRHHGIRTFQRIRRRQARTLLQRRMPLGAGLRQAMPTASSIPTACRTVSSISTPASGQKNG